LGNGCCFHKDIKTKSFKIPEIKNRKGEHAKWLGREWQSPSKKFKFITVVFHGVWFKLTSFKMLAYRKKCKAKYKGTLK